MKAIKVSDIIIKVYNNHVHTTCISLLCTSSLFCSLKWTVGMTFLGITTSEILDISITLS